MNNNDFKWIKDVFTNKLVILCIIVILILVPYFMASNNNLKIAIFITVLIIISIALILQWGDQKVLKKAEKIVIREADDEEKKLLRKHIKWNEEIRELFDKLLITGKLYYEMIEGGISIRTYLDRGFIKLKGKIKRGAIYMMTIDKKKELKKVDYLIKEGVIKKVNAKEGEPFTFKIQLMKEGKDLANNIRKIRQLSE